MRARSVFVIAGMSLFTLGFIVTVEALPRGAELLGSSEGISLVHSPSMILLVGFVASLAGLGLATIAPAVMFMRARVKSKV